MIPSVETLNSRESQRRYRSVWNAFDRDLSAAGIQGYVAELRDGGYAPATVNLHLAALKHLARQQAPAEELARVERIKSIPMRGTRLGTWLSIAQVGHLLEPGADLQGQRDRVVLALLVGTALRRAELAALTVDHLNRHDGRMCITDLVGKGRRIRTVPLAGWTEVIVTEWLEAACIGAGPVCRRVYRGAVAVEGLTPDHVHAIVKAAGKRIAVPTLAPHDLRRTFAQLARKGNAELEQIQLTLGHASLVTTQKYLGGKLDLENPACDAIKL